MNDNQVSVYKDAIIRAIPDPSTGNITQDTVFCLDPGYFTCTCKEEEWDKKEWNGKYLDYYTHIDGEISYEDKSGNIQNHQNYQTGQKMCTIKKRITPQDV